MGGELLMFGIIIVVILLIALYSRYTDNEPVRPVDRAKEQYDREFLDRLRRDDLIIPTMDQVLAKWANNRQPIITQSVPEVADILVEDEVVVECTIECTDNNETEYRMNIAKDPTDTTWFVCNRADLPEPSAAEYRIVAALEQYSIQWAREVSFVGLQFTTYSHPRFDFYLPRYRVVIEYDGSAYHNSTENKKTDRSKEKFCKDNGIQVIRYSRKHYYHIQTHIDSLMNQLRVRKKNPVG